MIHYLKNKYTTYKKRGFTLIELIVVMAVIAVLVLLAAPRFLGKTKEADKTKHVANAKTLEDAAERYFVDEQDWPRLTNDAYTSEEIISYSERVLDVTGEEITLDPEGNYYDIDYEALSKYVKLPSDSDKNNYVLRNPVGKIYYLEGLTAEGSTRVDYGSGGSEEDSEGAQNGYSDEEIDALVKEGYTTVSSAEELNKIRNDLSGKYVQIKNIDLSAYSNWIPVGTTSANSFTGIYDGGNYVITDLEVKGEGKDYQGLFGFTEGATIRNVGLIDNKVTGNRRVGGLVGIAQNGNTISNSYATGSVEGTESVGGLVGLVWNSTIESSYATGEVTGSGEHVGGLVGYAYGSTIDKSYATGSITGSWVGGLVGRTYGTNTISSSYAKGSVTGSGDYVGGLVGRAYHGTINISNSYATGLVTGANHVGGLVGQFERNANISNSYWDTETTGQSTSAGVGGIGMSTEEMMNQTSYKDWDFVNVWEIDEGKSYPELR